MSNTRLFIAVDQQKSREAFLRAPGTTGIPELGNDPTAKEELADRDTTEYDHVHLALIDGTARYVWLGRAVDGHRYPIGRFMVPKSGRRRCGK